MGSELGQGEFGSVLKGTYRKPDGKNVRMGERGREGGREGRQRWREGEREREEEEEKKRTEREREGEGGMRSEEGDESKDRLIFLKLLYRLMLLLRH